jgi:hypothetical protein
MRAGLFICAALLFSAADSRAHQEKKKEKSDKPVITVVGCVDGLWLRVRSVGPAGTGDYVERYRLVGPKQLLKEMSAQLKGHEIEVTGPVTDTGSTTHLGKTVQVGQKTRITTSAKEVPSLPTGNDPTLGVNSYRDLNNSCQ